MTIIIDYGMGNLRSVEKAVRALGATARISRDPGEIREAERLILPGVGAFGDAAAQLRSLDLDAAIQDAAAAGRPLLGICLGMQLLLDESLEFGRHRGLGLIRGSVVPFAGAKMQGLRIPHMGWNNIEPVSGSFLDGLPDSYMYFVHSFHASGVPEQSVAASCQYGYPFVCAVQQGNIWGTQFHPEKSGGTGLAVLERFLTLPEACGQPGGRCG